jgi:hypothetical protein
MRLIYRLKKKQRFGAVFVWAQRYLSERPSKQRQLKHIKVPQQL